MLLILSDVLDASVVASIRSELDGASFSEGAATGGWYGRAIKNNLQADHEACGQRVHHALLKHGLFRAATQPNVILMPKFSRYVPGMAYGPHVDDAIMGAQGNVRTDIAITVFLSDPASYDGGELTLELHGGPIKVKLPAGHAVAYPANTLHHVAEVTRGERLAAILWVQSLVRDPAKREILFDLESLRRGLWQKSGGVKTPESDLAAKSYVNLLRLWAEP